MIRRSGASLSALYPVASSRSFVSIVRRRRRRHPAHSCLSVLQGIDTSTSSDLYKDQIKGRMNSNRFALLAGLDDELVFGTAFGTADRAVGLGGAATGNNKKTQHVNRARQGPVNFVVDQTARPPIITPAQVNEREATFPPLPIRSVRDAKKASIMRLGVLVGTTEGSAVITYGQV